MNSSLNLITNYYEPRKSPNEMHSITGLVIYIYGD